MAGKSGGNQRKFERNKLGCKSYRDRMQGEQNQLRGLVRHIRRQGIASVDTAPGDVRAAFARLTTMLSVATARPILARLRT
jgi:hypothetical protein